ncbi:hypothetical protein ACOSQ3_028043 [Xanthoceras sorbifolium]
MATPGYYLAEAYVLRKMHKEKMKIIEEDKPKIEGIDLEDKISTSSSTGCFLWKVKKIHPKRVSPTKEMQ